MFRLIFPALMHQISSAEMLGHCVETPDWMQNEERFPIVSSKHLGEESKSRASVRTHGQNSLMVTKYFLNTVPHCPSPTLRHCWVGGFEWEKCCGLDLCIVYFFNFFWRTRLPPTDE